MGSNRRCERRRWRVGAVGGSGGPGGAGGSGGAGGEGGAPGVLAAVVAPLVEVRHLKGMAREAMWRGAVVAGWVAMGRCGRRWRIALVVLVTEVEVANGWLAAGWWRPVSHNGGGGKGGGGEYPKSTGGSGGEALVAEALMIVGWWHGRWWRHVDEYTRHCEGARFSSKLCSTPLAFIQCTVQQ